MLVSDLITLLKTLLTIFFFNDYFKRNYPQEYERFLIKVSMKLLYMYSKLQIIYNKFSTKINSYLNINKLILTEKVVKNEIYQIQNGEIYKKLSAVNVVEQFINNNFFKDFDNNLYIYSDNSNPLQDKCINKVIINNNNNNNNKNYNLDYDISTIKFMLLEVSLNNKTYKITLKNDTYNYYIVDNILDKRFFIYYLKNHNTDTITNEEMESIKDKINIKLIDNNVNVRELEITDEKNIVIKKDSYNY
jgi:hypothetical protein